MIDTAGLRDPEGIEMEKMMAAMSPELPDHMLQDTMSKYHPGLTPALRLKPNYAPHTLTHSLPPASPISPFSPAPVGFAPAPVPYTPVPVHPGPVLLEKKPYETKTVQALPVTVAETYTNFDCRGKYANRHYADPEAGCQVIVVINVYLYVTNLVTIIRSIISVTKMASKTHSTAVTEPLLMSILEPVITRPVSRVILGKVTLVLSPTILHLLLITLPQLLTIQHLLLLLITQLLHLMSTPPQLLLHMYTLPQLLLLMLLQLPLPL